MQLVFVLCGAYAGYCLASNPAGPLTTPDSLRYLEVSPIYPLGYPFFLLLTGTHGAIIVQPLLFSTALAFLGRELVRTTQSPWLAVTVIAGTIVVPQIREYHASILSESLFLSLLVVFLALVVRFMHQPAWQPMVFVAISAGLAATVRRTAFAFVPVMLAMVLLQRRHLAGSQTALFMVAALAPFAAITAIEQVMIPVVHGPAASSLLSRHLFAKAALIEAPPAPPSGDSARRAVDDHLEHAFAPIRSTLASAPERARAVLTTYYETCLQAACADAARGATGEGAEASQTALMGAAGLARIRRAPWQFLQLAWMHYRSLWTINRVRQPDIARDLNAFLATHRPLPYEELALSPGPDRTLEFSASQHARYAQHAFSAAAVVIGGLSLLACAAAVAAPRLPPVLGIASVSALTAQSALMMTALLAAGFARFLLGIWPAVVVALACACFAIVRRYSGGPSSARTSESCRSPSSGVRRSV
jgi:hypothetical protein